MKLKHIIKKVMPFLLLIAGLILSSCGTSDVETTEGSEEVNLTYMIWNASGLDGMEAVAEAFEEENPGINVEVQVTPWDQYWPKLEAAALGGSMPDLFIMHSQEIAKYAVGDVLMD